VGWRNHGQSYWMDWPHSDRIVSIETYTVHL